ncbi:MAG: 3'(2'),5'-bisphosphate nucleotidase CysQ [Methyloligellaceae bacterium]
MQYDDLFRELLKTVHEAGRVILDIYRQDFPVEVKNDNSPVTEADRKAEIILLEALRIAAPDIPVVAEESVSAGNIPEIGNSFFLVDPLDGTKEFINKRDEFTVNIGLIVDGVPCFGIVFAPAMKKIFYNLSGQDAFIAELDCENENAKLENNRRIETSTPSSEGYVVVASRSHMNDETKAFLSEYEVISTKSAGSSLKFCLLAAGEADLYPRLGPTMEWDTAAGHAVLQAAGGRVVKEDGSPFIYGKTDRGFLNTSFIAWGK